MNNQTRFVTAKLDIKVRECKKTGGQELLYEYSLNCCFINGYVNIASSDRRTNTIRSFEEWHPG